MKEGNNNGYQAKNLGWHDIGIDGYAGSVRDCGTRLTAH
jgi:hypothetical protein